MASRGTRGNPNIEIRNPKQIQMSKILNPKREISHFEFCALNFDIVRTYAFDELWLCFRSVIPA